MAGVIIDNGGAGYSTVGSWSNYNGYGGYNNTLQYNSNGGSGASATWAFTGLAAGAKWLGLSWVGLGSNSTVTPWQILDSNGTTVLASGTVNQQVSPSGELSGGARFQFLASVTISGTSCSVKMTGLASGQVMSDAAVVHPSTDPITSGSIANGNWSSGSTWTGGHVPVSGDLAVINHAVTVAADAVIGDGTASTVLTVGAAGTGSLTVSGAKLTIRGNCAVGLQGTAGTWLVVQNNGATPGGIVFYGNSGVRPTMSLMDDSVMTVTGTSSARCYLRSADTGKGDAASNAGNNAIVRNDPSNGNLRGLYTTIAYCDLYKLGDASTTGLTASRLDNSGFIAHPPFTMDHCAVDSCGVLPDVTISGGTVNFQLTSSTWTGGLATSGFLASISSAAISGGGTRLIDRCVCVGPLSLAVSTDLTITNSYFDDNQNAALSAPWTASRDYKWALLDGCFLHNQVDGSSAGAVNGCGDSTNNYYLANPVSGNSAYANGWLIGYHPLSFLGNVFQSVTTGGGTVLRTSDLVPRDVVYTVKYNIVLSAPGSPVGTNAGVFYDAMNTGANAPYTVTGIIEHNTLCTGTGAGVNIRQQCRASTITSLKGNVFWRVGATGTHTYAADDTNSPLIVDVIPAANVKCNGNFNEKAVPAGTYTAQSCTCQDGTMYSTPMSGATAPGAGDVSGDPQFVDATRNLQGWSTYKGGAGTIADALTRLQADPSLTKTDLIPWVRAGYRPTNVALKAASYAGDASTTDAAGNAWPGAGPDIGAMAYVAASVTGNPYLIQSAHDGGFFGG